MPDFGAFWKAALGAAGIGALAYFVFWDLYRGWMNLPIFSRLSETHTFIVMLVFLFLVFLATLAGLWIFFKRPMGDVPPGASDDGKA